MNRSKAEVTNRIIVIRASAVFPEAQNALLKSFEEPVQGTIFFVIVPTISGLLPTLLSRTIVLHHTEQKTVNKLSEDFLNGDYQSRIKIIESITKDLKDKKMERAELGEFIFVLEKNIYEQYVEIQYSIT